MADQTPYKGTPTPEADEVRRLTKAWLDERWPEDDDAHTGRQEVTRAELGDLFAPHAMTGMCPHCGEIVIVEDSLTVYHDWPKPFRQICPGSKQNPRCAESDARPLWNGEPNLHFQGPHMGRQL